MRTLFVLITLVLAAGPRGVHAQTDAVPSPLLLTTMPPPAQARIVTSLDLGYNERAFWDSAEAEGGATLFVGPTLAFSPSGSWRLVVGGGPVLRTTSSTAAPPADRRSGYVLRTSVRVGW